MVTLLTRAVHERRPAAPILSLHLFSFSSRRQREPRDKPHGQQLFALHRLRVRITAAYELSEPTPEVWSYWGLGTQDAGMA